MLWRFLLAAYKQPILNNYYISIAGRAERDCAFGTTAASEGRIRRNSRSDSVLSAGRTCRARAHQETITNSFRRARLRLRLGVPESARAMDVRAFRVLPLFG